MIDYESLITDIPGYPKPGIIFKDITTLLSDGEGFATAVRDIVVHFAGQGVTKVVGTEARGFVFGAPVAVEMGVGFVPVRKPGKLPRETFSQEYELEYGTDTLELHKDAIVPGDKVLIVDDLIATGGTAVAAAQLIQKAGGSVAGYAFLLELTPFNARAKLAEVADAEFYSLIQVDEY
ncbi:MAG: adenine phosphoribosyltransferase [Coriobacteriales bacterium]|jgi:adenine phosphoribosyltransferase